MINKEDARAVLDAALKAGGDFAEIFFDDTRRNSVDYKDGRVESALSGRDYGAGIRVMLGTNVAYGYTCDTSRQALMQVALDAAEALGSAKGEHAKDFVLQPARQMQQPKISPLTVDAKQRVAVARQAYDVARAHSTEIVQANSGVVDVLQNVIIANSDGVWVEDTRTRTRMVISAVASNGTEMQTGFEGPGAGKGFEFFDDLDVEAVANTAAKVAATMLHAPFAPARRMPVAIDGGFGGVIFHEACGHSLEATSVSRNNSEFTGKLGQKIAHEKVTAVDDGTLPGEWGSIGYDDEGHPSQRNVLIENGILKGYMVDMIGARRMDVGPTGNSRRQNYRYAPTSRMTNTFIADGPDDDVIGSIQDGLYAKKMGGGSVNPLTGEFNFAVLEGYLIKNGQVDKPVRGATLIGKGSEVLPKIDMVGKGMFLGEGMCGSVSGSVPTCVGQPLIRISDLVVGGREAE